ncbi:MAG: S1C family serine protease [Acidimicrobiia bacterium]
MQRAGAALAIGAGMLLAACGGGGGGDVTKDTEGSNSTDTSVASGTTAKAGAKGAVSDIKGVKSATVQIIAEGSLRDPEEGQTSTLGSGSGFIVDPSGVIVTNNHVVTGAGSLKVYIGGSKEAIPAKVLGVSECNDLAVIKLSDPGTYPFLSWSDEAVEPPMEVFTAGFPLGDPEFSMTKGVVSKAKADGQTSWASVRHVIEHDANIQPGNSGGPLVDPNGQVVGVNYAGGDPGTGTAQFFAIARDLAETVVESLKTGNDETIGVNGKAITSEDGSTVGVWVGGVAAGSPAAKAGVLPGDIITELNGVQMSVPTMEKYCDVLRTANEGTAISIQVLRYDTGEVWVGEINGAKMEARYSFAEELDSELPADSGGSTGTSDYTYEDVIDQTGTITVQVPAEWSDRDVSPQDIGLASGPAPTIEAAPNLSKFLASSTEPGVLFIGVPSGARNVDADAVLDALAPTAEQDCVDQGRDDYGDAAFTGRQNVYICSNTSVVVLLVAKPVDRPDVAVVVGVQAITDADLAALDNILYTFNIA